MKKDQLFVSIVSCDEKALEFMYKQYTPGQKFADSGDL
ncbi:hypothetical protein Rhein_4016 [Rheinheimera sp. A13L]|nr:hypothetical protein Rhein_4016 [Rheinheimera sp. A13L]